MDRNFLNESNNSTTINKKNKYVIYNDEEDKPLFYNYDMRKRNKAMMYLLDWATVVIVLIVGGILFLKVTVRGRLFTLDDESISYPKLPELVPMHILIPLIIAIPLAIIITISLIIRRDVPDFHHAMLGLAQSLALTLLLTGSFKCFIGGLRPNFLEVCDPTTASIAAGNPPVGYGKIYYDRSICSADDSLVNDALSAYPSGHSSITAASFGFLALYIHAKFKIFDNRGHILLYIIVSGCIIGAGLIGISRVADYRHTFLNVLAGWSIGLIIALSCYRLNYSSLFGRDNHVSIHSHWLTYWNHHDSLNNNNNISNITNKNDGRYKNNFDVEKNCNQSPNNIALDELNK
ncbi:hypothetical protein RB653_002437 [Dictyostelium firmibasis]|uniref:Phosphatidic acid phosphatase type 2/haloperoxidase domain-containing protein n=1 Tax=Dictyostelium firmibasis TaxID=79012 RepID=A0AAN7TX89_9MYCE